MSDRAPLTFDQLAELERASQEREDRIIRGMLQQPDYPPLPACPACGEHPESMRSTTDLGGVLLLDFAPCGHGFRTVAPA